MIVGLALSTLLLATPAAPAPPLLPVQAEAPPPGARPSALPRRRPVRRAAPRQPVAPPVAEAPPTPPPAPQAEIAPMPNRFIEGPRPPLERQATRLRPDLIEPRSLPDSRRQSGGNSSYTERQDRLYRDPAAGARLEIPFSY